MAAKVAKVSTLLRAEITRPFTLKKNLIFNSECAKITAKSTAKITANSIISGNEQKQTSGKLSRWQCI